MNKLPSAKIAVLPIAALLISLIALLIWRGADAINNYSPYVLLAAALFTIVLARFTGTLSRAGLLDGLRRAARQILPAVPLLALIGLVSTTWMLGGIVPTLIDYGLKVLNPGMFLALACILCAVVSVVTGSSWTTIATIGVAFMGIGSLLGYSHGWIAGAIISGAYFGDKVSPLSDTTIVASSTCDVDLFSHIRYMMRTTIPSFTVALAVYAAVGIFIGPEGGASDPELIAALRHSFNITPWVLIVPAVTLIMIAVRVRTIIVMAVSALMGMLAMYIWQPQVAHRVHPLMHLINETSIDTGSPTLDSLVATGGLMGMMPTIMLVLCAMVFGASLIGTGMIKSLARTITRRLKHPTHIVAATVASGLTLNACTADQYLSIIIGGNMYGHVYQRSGLEKRLLGRTLEDSISVTSVLIPWNSCGVTQSTVLGVATLVYLPFCIFNWLSPITSIIASRFVKPAPIDSPTDDI